MYLHVAEWIGQKTWDSIPTGGHLQKCQANYAAHTTYASLQWWVLGGTENCLSSSCCLHSPMESRPTGWYIVVPSRGHTHIWEHVTWVALDSRSKWSGVWFPLLVMCRNIGQTSRSILKRSDGYLGGRNFDWVVQATCILYDVYYEMYETQYKRSQHMHYMYIV